MSSILAQRVTVQCVNYTTQYIHVGFGFETVTKVWTFQSMGGMTVTEVDAGNIIVPPRQRKVNPVKEKISHQPRVRFMTRVITEVIFRLNSAGFLEILEFSIFQCENGQF